MPVGIPRVPFSFSEDERLSKGKTEDLFKEKGEAQVEEKDKAKKKKKKNEIWVDIYTRLYHERMLFCFGELNSQLANTLIALLTYFSIRDPKKEFFLFINSPGGGLRPGVSLYTTMQYVTPDINTVCLGSAYSMAAFILAGGETLKRMATPHARIMLHQPRSRLARSKASELFFDGRIIKEFTSVVINEFAKKTGKSESIIYEDMRKEIFLSPQEAQIHGIIDYIISNEE